MRKIYLFIATLLSLIQGCEPGFAQTEDTRKGLVYEINDFSGGLKSHISPFLEQKNSFTDARNVRINTKYGALAKRPKMLLLSACHAAPVKSLFRFYKSDDTKYILQTSSTYLDSVNESTGACTQLLTGLTDGKRWNWVTYKDEAIGINGTDAAIKWDGFATTTADTTGARTAGDLVTQLGAPFAKLLTGTNLEAAKWYQYRVAFYDGSVYKYSTARSNPILTGATVHDIALTDIPIGPIGTTARYVYRTQGASSRANVLASTTFYKVATIADNTTRTLSDTVSDATAAADAAPTWATVSAGINATPPHARFALIHQERLFLANDPSGVESGKSSFYWSDLFNPDYFNTATDYELVRADDGDEINAFLNLNNILTIGKANSWQKFYTDAAATTDWSLSDPFDTFGPVAPYSVVNGVGGAYYLSRSGIRTFGGQTSQLVSDVITDRVRDVQPTNLNEVVAAFYDNQYEMAYTSNTSGSAINDTVSILDLTRNAYVEDSKYIDSFAIFNGGTDTGILYSGSSNTDGSVYAHTGGFSTLIERYKSDIDAGTFFDTQSNGTEEDASISLGSNATWASDSGTWAADTSTWMVESSPGYWQSPIIRIDASSLDKLYWNELLGSHGDVTFKVRTGASSAATAAASYSSSVSSPAGSDISGVSANQYIQISASLTTDDFTETPYIFLDDSYIIKLTYTKSGTTGESSVLSYLQTGYTDLDVPQLPKRITEIQVHYTGTSGTMNIGVVSDDGNTSASFPIDLSILPATSREDQYYGTPTDKIYTFIPSITDSYTGRKFRFSVTENGTTDWQIRRIVVKFDASPDLTYR